jgi:hypothetical protein
MSKNGGLVVLFLKRYARGESPNAKVLGSQVEVLPSPLFPNHINGGER